jgi:hypothetical protein
VVQRGATGVEIAVKVRVEIGPGANSCEKSGLRA